MMGRRLFVLSRTVRYLAFMGVGLIALADAPSSALVTEFQAELSSSRAPDGALILVTAKIPGKCDELAVSGSFEDIELPFYSRPDQAAECQAFLGIPYNHKHGDFKVVVKYKDGQKELVRELPLSVIDGGYPSERLRVDPGHVNPNKKNMKRILREQKEVKEVYLRLVRKKYWQGPFVFPIDSPITSRYGTKRTFNGTFASFHSGIDLKAPMGTPIYAPAPGVVVMAKNLFYTGNTVLIDHGYGLITLYAHMSKLKVKKGQEVKTHTLLGLSGMTGRASGPHLHWQAIVHRAKVNPMDVMSLVK